MIPQLAGLFLLFPLCAGHNYLEFIPGRYPGEYLLTPETTGIDSADFPAFADFIQEIATIEEGIQFFFRFFNRPSFHRYFLDYVLLIGNFNISDEGYKPYLKRKDGLGGFLRGLDDHPSTEFLRKVASDAIHEASQSTEHENGQSTQYAAYQSTENYGSEDSQSTEQVGPSTEYTTYQGTEDYGSESSQSTEHEIKPSTEYTAYQATDDYGSESSQSTEHEIKPSTEYTAYQATDDYGSESSQSTEHEIKPTEFEVYWSESDSAEDSQSAEQVNEPSTVFMPYQSTEDFEVSQSTKDEMSTSEFKQRIGLPYKDLKLPSEPLQAGSIRGIPGVHFPDYYDIPITSFSCADKKYIPGFYADLETGCQVFHVCWPHRRESFLCPVGTTFNQAILTCDYWYSTNCSLSHLFFDLNAHVSETKPSESSKPRTKKPAATKLKQPHTAPPPVLTTAKPVVEHTSEQPSQAATPQPMLDLSEILKFFPIKSMVFAYPESRAPGAASALPLQKLVPKTEVKALKKTIASQLMKEVLEAAESLGRNAQPIVSATTIGYLPIELVQRVEAKQTKKPLSVPTVVSKFVVRPAQIQKGSERVVIPKLTAASGQSIQPTLSGGSSRVEIRKQTSSGSSIPAANIVPLRKIKPVKAYKIKTSLKPVKEDVPEIVMRALEMAGTVFQSDILPFTRQALLESYVKHSKLEKH